MHPVCYQDTSVAFLQLYRDGADADLDALLKRKRPGLYETLQTGRECSSSPREGNYPVVEFR